MKTNDAPILALVQKFELDSILKKLDQIQIRIDNLHSEGPKSVAGYISEKEAMALIGRKATWFWNLRRSSKLPYKKIGSKIFYHIEDLKALIENAKN